MMRASTLALVLLGAALVLSAAAQPTMKPAAVTPPTTGPAAKPATPQDAATLTMQFNNRQRRVLNPAKRTAVLQALATSVFNVPANQVTIVGGVDQSGILRSQSVVTFKAVGPTTNKRSTYDNCVANTRGFLLFRSTAAKAVKKATDTWWPGDSVKVQKAQCGKAPAAAGR